MTALETFGACGLYIDMQPGDPSPIQGDWITTRAGSRYLITASTLVASRRHDQRRRFRLRCLRLARHTPVPDDVRAIELRWYRRGRA